MKNRCAWLGIIFLAAASSAAAQVRGTGDLGIVIERAAGSLQVLDTTALVSLGRVQGLGDLSHASAVYSRDGRYLCVRARRRSVESGSVDDARRQTRTAGGQ